MPLHRIDLDTGTLISIQPITVGAAGMQERSDLQRLLRKHIEVLDPGLIVVDEEFGAWEESRRRIDLLALDEDANLVVIELKRGDEDVFADLQAIRYAAMVSAMTFEQVVQAHALFLNKCGEDPLSARRRLIEFLDAEAEADPAVGRAPRIVLVASGFSTELTTTVLWLNEQGLDIRCFQANVYELEQGAYLDIKQVLPLPSAADYQVRIRDKEQQAERIEKIAGPPRREKTVRTLERHGLLKPGVRLHLVRSPRPNLDIPEEAKWATYVGGGTKNVLWDAEPDSGPFSLSDLCRVICNRYGGELKAGAFPGPDFWAIEQDELPLYDRARELDGADSAQ